MTSRRDFLRNLVCAGGAFAVSGYCTGAMAQSNYNGKLLITVQLIGGWDVTSVCDPKTNVNGEQEINHWARDKSIGQAGNLIYAPFANNQQFFEKYYKNILVINGVDAQTNAHEVGELVNWSGRTAPGYPSITALIAAINAPELALSYLNFGGFGTTQNLIRSTRIDSPHSIRNIIYPNALAYQPDQHHIEPFDWERIQALQMQNSLDKLQQENVLAKDRLSRQYYLEALSRAESIKEFGDLIPAFEEIQQPRIFGDVYSHLHQQAQLTLLAFKAGVAITADLTDGGYDTHETHDNLHEPILANSLDGIDYLWDYAEQLGIADRLIVVIGSDFSRTPYYNDDDGKDHWPIGSYLVMEKNVDWANRMVGETDEGHNAFSINPITLNRDDYNGTIIYTRHVHKALRNYMGIGNNVLTKIFPFNNTEDFNIFS